MTTFTHSMDIELEVRRCYECGRVYAHESNRMWELRNKEACPYCAARIKDVHYRRIEELERTIAALRGALTKAKKR